MSVSYTHLDVYKRQISSRLGRTTVEVKDLCKAYGNKVLLKDFTYIFLKNDRVGIIAVSYTHLSEDMLDEAGLHYLHRLR